jgi:6-phosphogluconolactonase (cycloisomerase 2 family)
MIGERCVRRLSSHRGWLVLIVLVSRTAVAQPLDVDQSGPPVDPFTDLVYVARRLFGLPPVPPSFRVLDPDIATDLIIAGRVDAIGKALDVDDDGAVDAFTDVVYCSRELFELPPVPPSFRALDPTIAPDGVIAARCRSLAAAIIPSATPTRTVVPSPSASPTGSATATSTATPTQAPTASASPTRSATATPTSMPTQTMGSGRPCGAITLAPGTVFPIAGSTAGEPDDVQEAPCGSGGGFQAPDVVYEYVAPAAGRYDLTVDGNVMGTRFTPLVQLFFGDCQASLSVCRDDGGLIDDPLDPRHNQVDQLDGIVIYTTQRLEAGQGLAIAVDGVNPTGGAFTLGLHRRQPDLRVVSVSGPATAQAGDLVQVSATIVNDGDDDAGPFTVELLYARDAALAEPISLAPLVCAVEGLASQAMTTCAPLNLLAVPLVAAGTYSFGARVTGLADERFVDNDSLAQPATISAAPGVTLEQQVLRAADGTTYQVVRALPVTAPTLAGGFRLTTVGASPQPLQSCEVDAAAIGGTLRAAVGGAPLATLASIRRTKTLLRPVGFAGLVFDDSGSGRLSFGSDPNAPLVCASGTCGGEPLEPVGLAGDGISAGCAANRAGGFCPGGAVPNAIGFGVAATSGTCNSPAPLTTQTLVCNAAPVDGITIGSGEALVFVHAPGREAYGVGVAGFGLARDALNPQGCGAGQVLTSEVRLEDTARVPLLRLVQEDNAGPPSSLALSPDGRHLYVVDGGGTLSVFERTPGSSVLARIDTERDGLNGVRGTRSALRVLVSGDGAHVYVVGFFATVVFRRDPSTGTVDFAEVIDSMRTAGASAIGFASDGAISPGPQSAHVYIAAASGLTTLRRDTVSGGLTIVETEPASSGTVAVSPDGAHVYLGRSGALGVFRRDPVSGALDMPQSINTDLGGNVAVSGDGRAVYRTGSDALGVFRRTAATGALQLANTLRDGQTGVDGLAGAMDVASSPEGAHVYVASANEGGIAVYRTTDIIGALQLVEIETGDGFAGVSAVTVSSDGSTVAALLPSRNASAVLQRNAATGALALLALASDVAADQDDLPGADALAASPDGGSVYSISGNQLRVFRRHPVDGRIELVDTLTDGAGGVDGLGGLAAVAASPNGEHVYAAGAADDALAVFRRDAATGALAVVEVERDGIGGVEGLDSVVAVAVSSDGAHVYAAGLGDNSVAIFGRDPTTGALLPLSVIRNGVGGVSGLLGPRGLAISPNGAQVYVAADELVVFQRNAASGALTFADVASRMFPGQFVPSGFNFVSASHDGRHVYATSSDVRIYQRNAQSGALMPVDVLSLLQPPPLAMALGPDGKQVYVARGFGVDVYARDAATGALTFVESPEKLRFGTSFTLAVSPDSRHVYVADLNYGAVYERRE